MSSGLLNVLLLVPVFLFSLSLHEYAHAWVATRCGDKTAQQLGRLSMHPLAHADLVGTLLLPIICIYNGWPFFGWAKPVPIDSRNFRHGRRDVALVAAAGPASNILLALLSTASLALWVRFPVQEKWVEACQMFSVVSIQVNLMLAFFNLLPIPPLDGFNVLHSILPARHAIRLNGLARNAGLLVLLLLFTGVLRYLLYPVQMLSHWLVGIAA